MRKPRATGLVLVVGAVIASATYRLLAAIACEEPRIAGCRPPHSWVYTVILVAGIVTSIALLGWAGLRALYAPFAGVGVGAILAGTVGVPGTDGELVGFGVAMVAGPPVEMLLIWLLLALLGIASRRRTERLHRTGVEGTATVVSVLDEGTLNGLAKVRMRLRLETPGPLARGVEVERPGAFERLAVPRPGDRFAVMIDPDEPTSWVYAPGPGPGERSRLRNLVEIAKHAGRPAPPPPVGTANDQVAELRRLRDLHAEGRLSAAELAARSAEVLGPGEPAR
ncbi:MAG TPA: hypothetical protein VNA14_04015 [Mycobacteriales bacterium]|nr:hypothetical protein [Mycobacteriales bacterium]